MGNKSKDTAARIIAWASLGISILTLGFSYYQYNEDNKDKFKIAINRVKLNYMTRIEQENNEHYLLTWWECL